MSWFPELVAYARCHPEAGIGMHLTLNSEYQRYRWRPITACDPASGLLEQNGYQSLLPLHPPFAIAILENSSEPNSG